MFSCFPVTIGPSEKGWKEEDILSYIGISKCAIETGEHPYGTLAIRTSRDETEFPNTKGQILIGTWTHREIEEAKKRGDKILHIFWSITYHETKNILADTIEEMYRMKEKAETPMEKHFAKMLLNGSIGKFAQERTKYDYKWENIEKDLTIREKGYEPIEVEETERLYRKEEGKDYPKYYCPIINALITAEARTRILEILEELPREKTYYVDTDGIIADKKAIEQTEIHIVTGKQIGRAHV